ncbi:hypothetical protein KQX54_007696 [Cotesia glomerata]|uniref:Uncharacterized protein n=1 Tax=Cotesia glomerata TaxID=32391 RepID=A0AAV7HWV2_COTGL|nr:hypothetical protein KQX54_007696 [Cotesia glomerata]
MSMMPESRVYGIGILGGVGCWVLGTGRWALVAGVGDLFQFLVGWWALPVAASDKTTTLIVSQIGEADKGPSKQNGGQASVEYKRKRIHISSGDLAALPLRDCFLKGSGEVERQETRDEEESAPRIIVCPRANEMARHIRADSAPANGRTIPANRTRVPTVPRLVLRGTGSYSQPRLSTDEPPKERALLFPPAVNVPCVRTIRVRVCIWWIHGKQGVLSVRWFVHRGSAALGVTGEAAARYDRRWITGKRNRDEQVLSIK